MTPDVFLAVLAAAALHAGWNALVKVGSDKAPGMGAVALGHIPPALLCHVVFPLPSLDSLP